MGNTLIQETGNTYGHISVLGFDSFAKSGQAQWKCWCRLCDQYFTVLGGNLRRQIAKIKGCKGCRGLRARSPETKFYHAYKNGALSRHLSFEITVSEFNVLINGTCHYCGIEPSQHVPIKYLQNARYNGVDRVDSSLGYRSDNCVSCCSHCNYAKRTMSKDQFISWIERVYNHQKAAGNEGNLQESVGGAG